MSRLFEMSASGTINPTTIVECGVCWWTYDPLVGDMDHDLLAGVGFSDLPESFRCPCCDAPKNKFMIKPDSAPQTVTQAPPSSGLPEGPVSLEQRLKDLRSIYTKIEETMVGLPVHNPRLLIDFVSFREMDIGYVGAIITPWALNMAILPSVPSAPPMGPIGSHRDVTFPSGRYPFLSAHLDGFGALETCSLLSPLDEFEDPKVLKMTAEAAIQGLFTAPEKPKHSRRALFSGRTPAQAEPPGEAF